MINIRPVSDLRNKFPEIDDIVVNKGELVYLKLLNLFILY